jgi:hypothetical protein
MRSPPRKMRSPAAANGRPFANHSARQQLMHQNTPRTKLKQVLPFTEAETFLAGLKRSTACIVRDRPSA